MKILKVSLKNSEEIIKATINSIKKGGVVVYPTDTVYGLIADATSEKAVKKLFKIKRRKTGKSIPIFVKDLKMAEKLAQIDRKQKKFLKKVWPGKVTVILKRKGKIKIYGVNKKTIGLRTPNYKLINILLKKLKKPLTATSANISGKSASTKIREVVLQLKNKPDLIVDAGNLAKSKPSMIIDLTKKKAKILRKGG